MTDEHNKERGRDGAKSLIKAAWNKWRSRTASHAMQTAVKALVAATVTGGLAVGAVTVNNQLAGSKDSIKQLQAQNTQVANDLPAIHSDVDAAQRDADAANALATTNSADVKTVSAKNTENAQHIDAVSSTIEKDSKANSEKIAAVQSDLDNGKIKSAEDRQTAQAALNQSSTNSNKLAEEGKRVDGVASQVTDLATQTQANAKSAQTAQDSADRALGEAKAAATAASDAKTAADKAQATANAALAKANEIEARLPRYFSDPLTEGQNATLTAANGRLHNFNFVTFDGGKYLFNYTWLRSGFNTSCTGGIRLDGSAVDQFGRPYPIITPGTPIDDYTTQNFVTRSGFASPAAGSHNLFFVINAGGNCKYSDLSITITKVVSTSGGPNPNPAPTTSSSTTSSSTSTTNTTLGG